MTNQFHQESNHNDTPGEFVACKMSRTHVPSPEGCEGLEVGRIFADDKLHKGAITDHNDRNSKTEFLNQPLDTSNAFATRDDEGKSR